MLNPAFIILLLLIIFLFYWLISSLYKPIGRLFYRIFHDAIQIMNEEEKKEEDSK